MTVEEIRIRPYDEKDAPEIVRLFYETIRSVNLADYSQEQVEAWAPEVPDPDASLACPVGVPWWLRRAAR
jgi:hypothetical protein